MVPYTTEMCIRIYQFSHQKKVTRGFYKSGVSGVNVVGDVIESGVGKFEGLEMDKDLLRLKKEKYRIKSKVIDEKRWFLCPFETCEKIP